MTAAVVAAVWLVHGLYNKLLGGSPRHLAIVQSVRDGLGQQVAQVSSGGVEMHGGLLQASAAAASLIAARMRV